MTHDENCPVPNSHCRCDYRWTTANYNLSGLAPLPFRYTIGVESDKVWIAREIVDALEAIEKELK